MRRLLDDGSTFGIREYHDYDPLTDKTTIYSEADISPLLDHNKQLFNNGTNGYQSKAKEWKHVANIPHIVALKWLNEDGIDINNKNHWDAIKRKLNSSEYLYLRTSGGAI